jgi:selenoprotein W-related protein
LPRAASLATKILDRFKTKLSEVALVPSSGGAFVIAAGGEVVYSKLKTGTFPSENAVLSDLESKV